MNKLLSTTLVSLLCLCWASADEDYDLRINGDFRGAAVNAPQAPGWSVSPGEGSTRMIVGEDYDEFAIEVTAGARNGKTVASDLQPVFGNAVKLETELKGNGVATIGIAAYGADRKPLFTRPRSYNATNWWSTAKTVFSFPEPEVKFVQVILSANPGSTIAFADVEAEFKRYATVPAQPQTQVPAQPVAQVPAQPVAQELPQTIPPAVALPSLIHEKTYTLGEIGSTVCQATIPLGGDLDFKLEEDADQGRYWTITSYDPAICRVEMEHDRDGVWPFRRDQAEIELKGMARGTTTVLFSYPDGKSFRIHFTVR